MPTDFLPPLTASASEFDIRRSPPLSNQAIRKSNAGSVERASKPVRHGNKSLRSKTGCISCRVRRKKCDEIMNDAGACGTCVRLRIECLGFDSRRPEWIKGKEKEMTESFKTRTRCRRRAVSTGSFDFGNRPFMSIPSLKPEPPTQFSPQSSSHEDFRPASQLCFNYPDQVLLYHEGSSSQLRPWRLDDQDFPRPYVERSSMLNVDLMHLFLLGTTFDKSAQDLYYQLLSEPLAHENAQSPIGASHLGVGNIPHYVSRSVSYPFDIESRGSQSAFNSEVRDTWDMAASPQLIAIPQFPSSSMVPTLFPSPTSAGGTMIQVEDVMGVTRLTVWALAKTCQLASSLQTRQIYNKELVNDCTRLLCTLRVEEQQLASLEGNINSEIIATLCSLIKQVFNAAAQLSVCALMDHDEILSLPIQHAVTLTMSFLRTIATTKELPTTRSLCLPLFLCGALTRETEVRDEVARILLAHTELEDRFEDGRSILSVLRKLWWSVPLDDTPKSVPWRQALSDCSAFLL